MNLFFEIILFIFLLSIYFFIKRQQAFIQEHAARMEAILDNVIDGIVTIDDKGIIESANSAIEKIFGYSQAELLGKNISILMPEPYCSQHNDYIKAYLKTHNKKIIGIGRQVFGIKKNGQVFPMELAVSEMIFNNKHLFSGLVRDISEQVKVKEEIQDLLSLKQAIFDSANIIIISTDLQGKIIAFNQSAEKNLGYKAQEIIYKQTPLLIHNPTEIQVYAKKLAQEYQQTFTSDLEVLSFKAKQQILEENEWMYIRKDGSSFPVLLTITSLKNKMGEIIGYLYIAYDITERKRIDKMKSEFISTVSHELRTPLTSIRGSLSLIIAGTLGNLPEKVKPLLHIANKNAERLGSLINDILDIEKIEAGKMDFSYEVVVLQEIIQQCIEANQGFAEQFNITLLLEDKTNTILKVYVDKSRLEQVLANLISNACKFSPINGKVIINLQQKENKAYIAVMDYGEGIADTFKSRIFQKFAQADASDTRQKGGTGLGLSISKAIIETMQGEIGFTSVQGQGSTFYFYLPLYQDKPIAYALQNSKGKILVCEDNYDIAALLKLLIEQSGFIVDIAYSVYQAKTLLQQTHYLAITLDLMLPDEDGLSFLKFLRENKDITPVIIVSAKTEFNKQKMNAEALQIVDWIQKPIDNQKLIVALEQILYQNNLDNKPNILHVEDDEDIRQIIAIILKDRASLYFATNLEQARQQLQQKVFDLLLLDISLPDGSGLDLLAEIHSHFPNLPVVIFSAQQIPREIAQQVDAALVKAKTSNQTLLNTIIKAIENR